MAIERVNLSPKVTPSIQKSRNASKSQGVMKKKQTKTVNRRKAEDSVTISKAARDKFKSSREKLNVESEDRAREKNRRIVE